MRRKIYSIIFILALVLSAPAECFAEWVHYSPYRETPIVENIEYIDADKASIDIATLEENSIYLAPGVKETESISLEAGEKQHVDFTCEFSLEDKTTELILGRPEVADSTQDYGLATVSDQWDAAQALTDKNIVMGINTDMYNMETGEPSGIVIKDGKLLHENRATASWSDRVILYRGFFAVDHEGNPSIVNGLELCYDETSDTYTPVDADAYQLAVSGDLLILKDEMVFNKDTNAKSDRIKRHSRTAIGIKDDNTIVVFTTSGNVTPLNYGYTNQQVALIMKEKGCHTALMLDGAGSTTYVSKHPGETESVCRNFPGDGAEREVCTTLFVATSATKKQTTKANQNLTTCEKEGHVYQYKNNKITCKHCDFSAKKKQFSGLTKDVKTGKYMLFYKGKTVNGFVPYGLEEVFYFDDRGLSCTVEKLADVKTTCTKIGYRSYTCKTAPAGYQDYNIEYSKAPGHDYNRLGKCTKCGWKKVNINDCTVSIGNVGYTGKAKIPSIKVIAPNGVSLTRRKSGFVGDFIRTAENNVEIGTATLTIKPIVYYVNRMEDRSSITGTRTIEYQILPYPATNLQAEEVTQDSVTLHWTASASADALTAGGYSLSYDVYQKTSRGWKLLGNTTKTTFAVTGLEKCTTYPFRVCATTVGKDGKTYDSWTSAETKVKTAGLDVPVVKASNVEKTGKVKLEWSKVEGADGYQIYRAMQKAGKYKLLKTVTKTTFINTSAKTGELYYYKVKAVNNEDKSLNSDFSQIVKRRCDLARPVVTASNDKKTGKPKLTWKKVSGAEKYKIYRATSRNGKYVYMNTVTGNSYINKSAKKGKTYYYKVKAIDTDHASANSAYSIADKRKCKS